MTEDRQVCLNCGGNGFDENDFTANDFYMAKCKLQQLSYVEQVEVYKQALKWSAETSLAILNSKPVRNLDEQISYFETLIGDKIRE